MASTAPLPTQDYPQAERLDLVERLPESEPTHDVADPYRWLEDDASEATQAWSAAQDELLAEHRARWAGREHAARPGHRAARRRRGQRAGLARRAAVRDPPRRPGRSTRVLLVVDGDGTERVLLDPMAIDPSGATTLDSWQPSKEGHLLAYQLSEGGREESVLRVMDVATGELVDGPIDRARYSPVAWLPGGEAFYYVRRIDTAHLPADEQQYHRRVWLHRVGTEPGRRRAGLRRGPGEDELLRRVGVDGRALAQRHRLGRHGAAQRPVAGRPGRQLARGAGAGRRPGQRRGRPDQPVASAATAAATCSPTGTPRAAGSRSSTRPRPAYEHWVDLIPQDDEAVLEGFAVLDGPQLEQPRCASSPGPGTRSSELTVHDLATGDRIGEVPLPGVGSVGGLTEHPEGGHEAWIGYTDSVTPEQRAALRRADRRDDDVGDRAGLGRRARR